MSTAGCPAGVITAPFTYDGAGTFCWRSGNLGSYINSWNLNSLTVNGVNLTNVYVPISGLPARIGDGYWYIGYVSNVAWGHFEARQVGDFLRAGRIAAVKSIRATQTSP